MRSVLLVLCTSVTLTGCGHRYFAPRPSNPVIEDRARAGDTHEQKMSIISTRADRRTIMILGPKIICAEPAPDVGEAVASQAAAQMSYNNMNLGAGHSSAATILPLAQRSQGFMVLNSASFIYCNMWINDVINKEQYIARMDWVFSESVKLIAQQIEKNNLPQIGGAASAPVANNVEIDADPPAPQQTPPANSPAPNASPGGTTAGPTTPKPTDPKSPATPAK